MTQGDRAKRPGPGIHAPAALDALIGD